MPTVNPINALVASATQRFGNNDYLETFIPDNGAKPYRLVIPRFAKERGRPVLVLCLKGTVQLGIGRFAIRKTAHKVWYVRAEPYECEATGKTKYRPQGNATAVWPNVVLGQDHERVMRRFCDSISTKGVPVMR